MYMVCADAMHKLVDRIPFYELLIEDGNIRSEIAALGLLVSEQQETLDRYFNKCKEWNSACSMNRVFITDKDMEEHIIVIKSLFSQWLVICLFHTWCTFNLKITWEKLGITPDERDTGKIIIEKLCNVKSGNFLNTTNNRIESFNSKLKSVITTFSNLLDFFKQLLVVLNHVCSEKDGKTIGIIQNVKINSWKHWRI